MLHLDYTSSPSVPLPPGPTSCITIASTPDTSKRQPRPSWHLNYVYRKKCWTPFHSMTWILQIWLCFSLPPQKKIIWSRNVCLRENSWQKNPKTQMILHLLWLFNPRVAEVAPAHTWYLSFFLHWQNFWRIKFTPKNAYITTKYTVNCQFFALLRQNTQ